MVDKVDSIRQGKILDEAVLPLLHGGTGCTILVPTSVVSAGWRHNADCMYIQYYKNKRFMVASMTTCVTCLSSSLVDGTGTWTWSTTFVNLIHKSVHSFDGSGSFSNHRGHC